MFYKRVFDFFASLLGLLFLSPLFFIVSFFIKILMPGPIFFIQERVGLSGKLFKLIKFRTMTLSRNSNNFEPGNKNRITTLGNFLRKSKIDELPQLVNVLKGDMSFVGPRPEVVEWTKVYKDLWAIVHEVKPGVTDNASLVFRNEEEILANSSNPIETYKNEILPHKLELYIDYVNNRTFLSDILIIIKTIKEVITK